MKTFRLRPESLHYRVMFDPEVTVPFLDDGNSGDGAAGDGVYGTHVPAGVFAAGQMVRWYITAADAVGRVSRFPAFIDPENSPEYCGTIVEDPSLTHPLPVLHWFVRNPNASQRSQHQFRHPLRPLL